MGSSDAAAIQKMRSGILSGQMFGSYDGGKRQVEFSG
jgi:hypothetical protein